MASLGRDIAAWPVPLRRAVDSIAVMLMQVYMLARGRAAASASPVPEQEPVVVPIPEDIQLKKAGSTEGVSANG